MVASYLIAAGGIWEALAALYRQAEAFYTPPLAVRATVDNCVRAMWILGEDMHEPSEARLARAYLDALLSDEEQKKNSGRMWSKTSPAYVSAEATFQRRRAEVMGSFPAPRAR